MNSRNAFRRLSAICTLIMFSAVASAQGFTIYELRENLDALPSGYALSTNQTTNATAAISLGDVGGSNGLVFEGSWTVAPQTQEDASGSLNPMVTFEPSSYQFNPSTQDLIGAIRFQLDAAVTSPNMDPDVQGIFAQLNIFQRQADGSALAFTYPEYVLAESSRAIDVVLSGDDFVGTGDTRPDFGPQAEPFSFSLQLGARYPRVLSDNMIDISGIMTADNWIVEVIGMPIFDDGFENPMVPVSMPRSKEAYPPAAPAPPPLMLR